MNTQSLLGAGSADSSCRHRTRSRDNNSGFASAETVCVDCGRSFDAEQERQLRVRDDAERRDSYQVGQGKGYTVG